ncbi:flagellar hook-associated protein FlgK [Alkalihalophilus pseudofirmus OF4]|uniref:Flagellar hook-associated protein 1 n=1 Tax=Alkalihalophilus pseudofirmus (strain ATCC BAA-2126 / JCM 17055 / OF4) TaxID=398511 RepID=D3FYH0_ALKPO|nr:flagellar hook-associated protein FlgK [Alkalihalophilus pseudofirmus]ADC49193.1 flagellar hook-associated protein FlgK [Alkalihalophilus pseudofirmus OF4]
MKSTFHGLETARRAMMTQQYALHTTGHNIANANTPGYSRQRVNFTQAEPYPSIGMNRPMLPGHLGTGTKAGSIQRVREHFLDIQFRNEQSKTGYWSTRHTGLQKMEDILNEPSTDGIASTMDRFWNALQDLSTDPQDSGARSVVRERGVAVAEVFNYVSNSLTIIQKDLKGEIGVQEKAFNSILDQIKNINEEISKVEPHGYVPNDLYDRRDNLIDELSQYVNVKIDRIESGGNASSVAEGAYNVRLVDSDGKDLGITLIDGANHSVNYLSIDFAGTNGEGLVENLSFGGNSMSVAEFESRGSIKAIIESFGYMDGGAEKGVYPEMLHDLDQMVATFVEEFNKVHRAGWNLEDIEAGEKGPSLNFFTYSGTGASPTSDQPAGAASRLQLSADIMTSSNKIAAAKPGVDGVAFVGSGANALELANVKDKTLNYGGTNTSVQSFYQSVIGDMAVHTNEANRMMRNADMLRNTVEERRQSVSSVSLDEEMTDMIKFQHAYNAAARNITMVDEMLDRIINGLGVVGR